MSLLSSCTSGGCGAKLGADALAHVLDALPRVPCDNLLVGYDARDDACAYRIDDQRSLVSTVDFFPPMVDDPLIFGRVAAANALSDVYAMGAEPLFALNLLCVPQDGSKALLEAILRGGAEKLAEAGVALGGGHSIYDHEIKYGLAVTGIADTARILRNDTPRIGDRLILTKPLGTGIVLAAARVNCVGPVHYDVTLRVMQRLNRDASRALRGFDVSACTDVTGFGLLAHAAEMAGRNATLRIDTAALPIQDGALAYAADYMITAGGQRNREHMAGKADVSALPFAVQELLFDPQTSGGLLIAVAADEAAALLAAIRQNDPDAALIGEVLPRAENPIDVKG